jgi:hypothetical protein
MLSVKRVCVVTGPAIRRALPGSEAIENLSARQIFLSLPGLA